MNRILILSDLHLGAADALDDFVLWGADPAGPAPGAPRREAAAALDHRFRQFLRGQSQLADGPQTLLLLGDFLDLWQIDHEPADPAEATRRALGSHPEVVVALRDWTAEGHSVAYILGNHDHAACHPKAWAVLHEVVPRLNAHCGGAPAWHFRHDDSGLYATHGNRWDSWNRINRRTPDDSCVGRLIDHLLLNPLEPRFPLIDKGDMIWFLRVVRDAFLSELLPAPAGALLRIFQRVERGAWRFADQLAHALDAESPLPEARLRAESAARYRESLRRDLGRRLKLRAPELPAAPRIVAFGHTHGAAIVPHGGVQYLNTGTWRPLARAGADGALTVAQPLHWSAVERRGGEWRVSLAQEGG